VAEEAGVGPTSSSLGRFFDRILSRLSLPHARRYQQPVNISITAQNGFTGNVQVTLAGIPAGVVAKPSGSFSATTSGLSIVKLANVLLGIGALTPASGSAAGGSTITLRGSGFQAATKVNRGSFVVKRTAATCGYQIRMANLFL
jgi:hypothetical protein